MWLVIGVQKKQANGVVSFSRKIGQRQRLPFLPNPPNVYFGLLPIQINQANRLGSS